MTARGLNFMRQAGPSREKHGTRSCARWAGVLSAERASVACARLAGPVKSVSDGERGVQVSRATRPKAGDHANRGRSQRSGSQYAGEVAIRGNAYSDVDKV